ncbi:DUF192 domain-containing protein [Patescibacteria group bacterium]
MKKTLGLIIFLVCLPLGLIFIWQRLVSQTKNLSPQPYIEINQTQIWVEIASSSAQKAKGLSDREDILPNNGMLFLYNTSSRHSFWMKGMKFALDFIFIEDQEVVDLVKNVPPPLSGEIPQSIWAKKKFNKAIEVKGGMIDSWQIQVGDQVKYFL